jgi:hypothetical protein
MVKRAGRPSLGIPLLTRRLQAQIKEINQKIRDTKAEDIGGMGRKAALKESAHRRQEAIAFMQDTYPPPLNVTMKMLEDKFGFKYYIYE